MLPGTDALGYIACTGTNFCLRCAPLADCGFFPSWTITEDYALGMILKAKGYKAGYLNEYLAIGEAPEEIRNIFRQRSRWCKGQMQVRVAAAAAAQQRRRARLGKQSHPNCAAGWPSSNQPRARRRATRPLRPPF